MPFLPDPSSLSSRIYTSIRRLSLSRRSRATNAFTQKTAAIYRLPPEVLLYIFTLGTHDDTLFAISASHVCTAWRQLALRSPTLWRCINLDHRRAMWKERLVRAKSCTLDIFLRQGFLQPLDFFAVQAYIDLVIPSLSQWRRLEFRFTYYAPYLWNAALSHLSTPGAPALEQLALIYRDNDDPNEFSLFANHTPCLKRLSIDGLRIRYSPSFCQNLTFLDYSHHGFTTGPHAVCEFVSVLRLCFRLSELRLLFPRHKRRSRQSKVIQTISSPKRITLPFLACLHLITQTSDIPYELTHVASLLSSPALTSMHFVDIKCHSHTFDSLHAFFRLYRLPPTVQTLTIADGWYDARLLPRVLEQVPRIEQLAIREWGVPDQFYHFHRRRWVDHTV